MFSGPDWRDSVGGSSPDSGGVEVMIIGLDKCSGNEFGMIFGLDF